MTKLNMEIIYDDKQGHEGITINNSYINIYLDKRVNDFLHLIILK